MNTIDYFACKALVRMLDHKYPDVFLVGGSVRTNPNTANDFDLIMTETAFRYACTQTDLARDWNFHVQDHTSELSEAEEKYRVAKAEDRFVCDLRHSTLPLNIIVITDRFLPAYSGAIENMCRMPGNYDTREKWIKLHKNLCDEVRNIAAGNSPGAVDTRPSDIFG